MDKIIKETKIVCNKIMCRRCGEIIESKHRHDYQTCKCGACAVDGGRDYLRRTVKNREDIIEMSDIILVEESTDPKEG